MSLPSENLARGADEKLWSDDQRYKCLSDQLDRLHALIRQSDAKAIGIMAASSVAVNAVVAMVFRSSMPVGRPVESLLGLALLAALISACMGIFALLPRLKNPARDASTLHFQDVVSPRWRGQNEHTDQLLSMSSGDWQRELSNQLWSNAHVARRKYRWVKIGALVLLFSLCMLTAAVTYHLWV